MIATITGSEEDIEVSLHKFVWYMYCNIEPQKDIYCSLYVAKTRIVFL